VRRPLTVAALAAASLGLAACGASNSSDTVRSSSAAPATVTVTAPPATVVTPTSTAAPTPTPTTATTTAPPASTAQTVTTATITAPDSGGAGLGTSTVSSGTPACVADDLKPTALPPNSAPGTTVLGITLTNTGSQACHTYGWPGVTFVDSAGRAVSTLTTRSTHDVLGSTPATSFTIAPGAEASFRVTVHDAGGGSQNGCADYSELQIIAPDDTATMDVELPDGAVQTCGNVAVSAVEPGTSATGQ
jgi:hypothetical protein